MMLVEIAPDIGPDRTARSPRNLILRP